MRQFWTASPTPFGNCNHTDEHGELSFVFAFYKTLRPPMIWHRYGKCMKMLHVWRFYLVKSVIVHNQLKRNTRGYVSENRMIMPVRKWLEIHHGLNQIGWFSMMASSIPGRWLFVGTQHELYTLRLNEYENSIHRYSQLLIYTARTSFSREVLRWAMELTS